MIGNGLAQLGNAAGRGIGEQGGLVLPCRHVPQQLHPNGKGKHVLGHGASHKVGPVFPLGGLLGQLSFGAGLDGFLPFLQVADVIATLGQGI